MSEQPANGVPWWRNDPWLGRHLFDQNREKNLPLLAPYMHQHVAWYPDGSGIRDADPDPIALMKRLQAAGEDVYWYNFEYVSDQLEV